MTQSSTDTGTVVLPPVLWHRRHALGEITHVLRPEQEAVVKEVTRVHVSPRIEEKLLVLESGERVVLTTRRTCPRPDTVTGVLRRNGDGNDKWLSHRLLTGQEKAPWKRLKAQISSSWRSGIRYTSERLDEHGKLASAGLRPPQVGALHAIGAHWSLHKTPATIVMPTGTGKTETMIATLVGEVQGTLLVVVPSSALRKQTQAKFTTLGLLRALGVVSTKYRNPIVGTLLKRPRTTADLEFFKECHVVIGTMAGLSQGTAAPLGPDIAKLTSTLIIDEAHHVAARSWTAFRRHFLETSVLQFTATPFRRDGVLVDGDVIYSYPLSRAQEDGYFKRIEFEPVFELDPHDADRAIADRAIAALDRDLGRGLDHVLMARCGSIDRARAMHALYEEACPHHRPILVHSDEPKSDERIRELRSRQSRVVVCVEMLGEGFDLPQLKVAAAHDTHKSLAVLLQFAGRFTRTAPGVVGDATFIANIANQNVSTGLERLYSEDPDWNHLLAEFSSTAAREHRELVEFLRQSQPLSPADGDEHRTPVSPSLLRPKFSTVTYHAESFSPQAFHNAVVKSTQVHRVWQHNESNTLFYVTKTEPAVQWTRAKSIHDTQWDLFVLHYDPELRLLFVHSSDKSSLHENIAKAVGGDDVALLRGDRVFRILAGINRLQFQNIGITKHARRNLRYAMYTGSDVEQALTQSHTAGSTKSNLQGTGYEAGAPVAVGCSYKGRVWSKESGTIRDLTHWCRHVGTKLVDDSINTDQIIDNVMIPREVGTFPDAPVLCLEWPIELLKRQEDRILVRHNDEEIPLSLIELAYDRSSEDRKTLWFHIEFGTGRVNFRYRIGPPTGFSIDQLGGDAVLIGTGRREEPLANFLSECPPLVRFLDLSELDGNLLVRPQDAQSLSFPRERFEPWDWSDTDVAKESLWKDGRERPESVQAKTARHFIDGRFDVVFDDDGPGEAADLVCLRADSDVIRFALVHCKYSSSAGGARVKDAVEVCSQAVRSGRWIWNFKGLCRHIFTRERLLRSDTRPSRFLKGTARDVNELLQVSRFRAVRGEILIVQPGISQERHSSQQAAVLAAAHCFLKDTVDIPLDVICAP
ncbi:MAG: DEAD/DEAH box helicase family protein [Gammaproteobacteria bacterium]|nr:DEAD/DEAH box helicase family protein [Gammaproteobacteria bacterium]